MMNFRTILPIQKANFEINHQNTTMSIGSCFADEMGDRLSANKFTIFKNPFGILYNPMSIGIGLEKLLSKIPFKEKDLFQHLGYWHSFQHHSQFSRLTKVATLESINEMFINGGRFLSKTDRLILTLGTANVFFDKKNDQIVANCHKMPAAHFSRRMLKVEEISTTLRNVFTELKAANPELLIIMTVSPIRHIRDGLSESQISKATLLLAIRELTTALDFVHYFPAYELVLDDLRDYRFYKSDMIHPTKQAVNYIWDYFKNVYFSENTQQLIKQISAVKSAASHRPFHPNSVEHQRFAAKQWQKTVELAKNYPFLDFSAEKTTFRQYLT